jgi:mono/diheme cytochrome c family protein
MRSFTWLCATVLLVTFSFQQKPKFDLSASKERGKEIYQRYCQSCHLEQGEGLEGVFPPLAKSDYMLADKKRAIRQTLYGASGEMVVNGKTYNGVMTGFEMSDDEMSDLMNYIFNSFGNKGGAIMPAEVKAARNGK